MNLLEGRMRDAIAKGFKGKLLKGTLTRLTASGGLDEYGDPVTKAPTNYPFEGIIETWSSEFRTRFGVNDTDTGILIIAGSIGTKPVKDDVITLRGREFKVRKLVAVDPAEASYQVAGYER